MKITFQQTKDVLRQVDHFLRDKFTGRKFALQHYTIKNWNPKIIYMEWMPKM